jgi:hypothetical protein
VVEVAASVEVGGCHASRAAGVYLSSRGDCVCGAPGTACRGGSAAAAGGGFGARAARAAAAAAAAR